LQKKGTQKGDGEKKYHGISLGCFTKHRSKKQKKGKHTKTEGIASQKVVKGMP